MADTAIEPTAAQTAFQNTIATFNVLEAMRVNGVERIAFSSTGSIYGEAAVIPFDVDVAVPTQLVFHSAAVDLHEPHAPLDEPAGDERLLGEV